MTKHYCDRCEEETKEMTIIYTYPKGSEARLELCDKCTQELTYFLSPLKGAKNE